MYETPELNLLFRKEYIRFFLLMHIPFYIWLFFSREYPDFLATVDATIALLAVLYSLIFRPKIMNGTISAYYRKHYRIKTMGSLLSVAYTAIWFGAFFRSTLLVTNFLIQYFTFEKEDIPSLVAGMKMNYLNANGAITGSVLFCLFLYLLFYKGRYICVQEFSDVANIYVKDRGLDAQVTVKRVLYGRHTELEKNNAWGFEIISTQQEFNPTNATSQSSEPIAYQEVQSHIDQEPKTIKNANVNAFPMRPMRRHARK